MFCIRTLKPTQMNWRGPNGGVKYLIRVPKQTLLDRIESTNGSLRVDDVQGSFAGLSLLRRVGDGDLGRVHAPGIEGLAERLSRDVERLTGAVASAALLVAGSMIAGMGGWRETLGTALIIAGILGSLAVALGAWYRSRRD